ncbi:MAG: 3'-5' exonuclease [Xanthobacteraceae bacterium]
MEDGVLPHANSDDIEEERRVAYVGVTRARRRLALTYSAERYGERSKPSPFLFGIAGGKRLSCTWTGPKLEGADDRLPLPTTDEKRRHIIAYGNNRAASVSSATRPDKGANLRKRMHRRGTIVGRAD